VKANGGAADSKMPGGRTLGRSDGRTYAAAPDASTVMNANMLGASGAGQPHANMQPYLAVNFCIAMVGIFPARPDV